ncbi:MAG: signal peptidase II [Hyphomicrobiales bacterium]|nr:signal peptidase II [Hyphomicrobiales bacterium]MBV9517765.1 signal peptidase II [Hyphomicrobiales bacterium]
MSGKGRGSVLKFGCALALAVVLLDQACNFYVLHVIGLTEGAQIAILPFLDVSFVWNHGISYGLFQQHSEWGRWILVAGALAAVIFIALWLTRTKSLLVGSALGLIGGGALGNALDRAIYGAVIDFLHLHGGAIPWLDFPYSFNLADAAISLGVVLLIIESIVAKEERLEESGETR